MYKPGDTYVCCKRELHFQFFYIPHLRQRRIFLLSYFVLHILKQKYL